MGQRIALIEIQAMLLIILVGPVTSQSNELLKLSIDCGSDEAYVDTTTNLMWVTDANFTSTGHNAQNLTGPIPGVLNGRQANTSRYFGRQSTRDCYVLPVKPQRTYLLRLTFFAENWRIKENDYTFNVYINATLFLRFTENSIALFVNSVNGTVRSEAIFYSPGGSLGVCLTKRTGAAFISAIELRELSDNMYLPVAGAAKYLSPLFERINAGVPPDTPYLRYPDDEYDRLWKYYPSNYSGVSSTRGSVTSTSSTQERPPRKVMEDAWIINSSNFPSDLLYFSSDWDGTPLAIYSYFQEVDGTASASNVRGVEYSVNGILYNTFNVSDQPLDIAGTQFTFMNSQLNITVKPTSWSRLPPIINAIEVYFYADLNTSFTKSEDANVIARVKDVFNMTGWDGDPCVPVPFDWIQCELNVTSIPYGPGGLRSNPIPTLVITNLTLENVSTSKIARIPEEIGQLAELTELNLGNKGLSDIGTTLANLSVLTILELSNNNLSYDVGDLTKGVISPSVKILNVANNSLRGQFSVDQLAQAFPTLESANFDGNANISGSLNLSTWLRSMRNIANDIDAFENPSVAQMISLRYNKIDDVYPSETDLTQAIYDIINSGKLSSLSNGILLFGNPWCNQTSFKDQSLARQYLCRSRTGTSALDYAFPRRNSSNNKKVEIIVGTVIGSCALLVCCILLAILWRLRKKSAALRMIQEALAKEEVHPPFYSFAELQKATKGFSSDNKLGQGAYGAVYKGTLPNGTMVAVKTLFPSSQALSEFLRETVLITGIKHRHLIQLRGCCIKEERRMLVYELAENGNLAEALWGTAHNKTETEQTNKLTLDWETRLNICIGVGRGLSYLHEELQPRIVHRDIKPENILIDASCHAKIADFGLARSFLEEQTEANYTHLAGTPGYCAPEYVTQGQLTEKADVFSFGVVLLEIVSGRKSVDKSLPETKISLVNWANTLRKQATLSELLDPEVDINANKEEMYRVIDTAFLCLSFDPNLRPKMSVAVTMLQGFVDVGFNLSEDSQSFRSKLANLLSARTAKFSSMTASSSEQSHLIDRSADENSYTSN